MGGGDEEGTSKPLYTFTYIYIHKESRRKQEKAIPIGTKIHFGKHTS